MITIEIGEIGAGRYQVLYQRRVLIASCREPEFSACRALIALGVTGLMETYRRTDKRYACMRIEIQRGARLTVSENRSGIRIVAWRPFTTRTTENADEQEPALT
jgi:hypothetical protein